MSNFCLIAQAEVSYLKDKEGDIIKQYYPPANHWFIPGVWKFEEMPTDFHLKTMNAEQLKDFLNQDRDKDGSVA